MLKKLKIDGEIVLNNYGEVGKKLGGKYGDYRVWTWSPV